MRTAVTVAIFGALGALCRNALDGWVAGRVGGSFPWGTLVVNISGCLALGIIFTLLTERALLDASLRFGITAGFIGSYTTFSAWSLETVRLLQDGRPALALGNVGLSVVLGLFSVYAGIMVARALP